MIIIFTRIKVRVERNEKKTVARRENTVAFLASGPVRAARLDAPEDDGTATTMSSQLPRNLISTVTSQSPPPFSPLPRPTVSGITTRVFFELQQSETKESASEC